MTVVNEVNAQWPTVQQARAIRTAVLEDPAPAARGFI
jgi:hypothetical protein